jgi:hypothetical protein
MVALGMVGVGNNGKDKRLLSPEMAYVGSTLLGRNGGDDVEMLIVAWSQEVTTILWCRPSSLSGLLVQW